MSKRLLVRRTGPEERLLRYIHMCWCALTSRISQAKYWCQDLLLKKGKCFYTFYAWKDNPIFFFFYCEVEHIVFPLLLNGTLFCFSKTKNAALQHSLLYITLQITALQREPCISRPVDFSTSWVINNYMPFYGLRKSWSLIMEQKHLLTQKCIVAKSRTSHLSFEGVLHNLVLHFCKVATEHSQTKQQTLWSLVCVML